MKDILPCPFCGKAPNVDTCDRLISIGCKTCGYSRGFPGLLQQIINDKPIPYRHDDGTIGPAIDPKNQEYYHYDAHEKATETWNLRALGGMTDEMLMPD